MTRERIKDFKEIVLPFFTNYLLKENYENLGKSDAEEFKKDFNEIIELADKALKREPILDRDCEHCSKIYGTLECCDSVSNKWVYSCKEGHREYLLNKIRTEIEKLQTYKMFVGEKTVYVERDDVLAIIDKYKAESEDKE